MGRKYKLDIEEFLEEKERNELLDILGEAAKHIGSFDINEYSDDNARVSVFESAGATLANIIGDNGNVIIDKQEDTVGGEITVNARDISLSGDELKMFISALSSANSIEFMSFTDGHTELGLIYRDLKKKGANNYAS